MRTFMLASIALVACTSAAEQPGAQMAAPPPDDAVVRGRMLVLTHACGICHGNTLNPAADGYLAGLRDEKRAFDIVIPDSSRLKYTGRFRTRPRNLTPDNLTGLGRFTERQIFNALRFGLRPGETPDVEITSTTPGQGNFPATPKFLAPPMPWPAWRHMTDQQLHDIAAYLKRGLKPVSNKVQDSEGPPDFWAEAYSSNSPHPAPPFPTANENASAATDAAVLRGRTQVIHHACGDCHGGGQDPSRPRWLRGARTASDTFLVNGFATRPRNLTPDTMTGLGRFSERQIFNALRFGLKPGETPDVEITSTTPGKGNFPSAPKYLAQPMPWPAFRHLTDQQLHDIVAYLKRGVKPASNKVLESEGSPEHWANQYTVEKIGPYPVASFPTVREQGRD